MKILFMGTPDFAIPSLQALLDSPHEVVGVVTQPDRPQGRGLKAAPAPVKRMAAPHGLRVLQPDDLSDGAFIQTLREMEADVFVVVAFRILPIPVLGIPPKGAINLHASLLPKYRGAAPIQWAIIKGERETGVTTFFIDERVDTGRILLQRSTRIGPDETAGELHDRLSGLGAGLVRETVDLIGAGQATPAPQSGVPSRARKLTKKDGRIDWAQPARKIHDRIRGMNPYPVAFTAWKNRTLRIWRSRLMPDEEMKDGHPGELIALTADDEMVIRTGGGCIALTIIQPEGRRQMRAGAFARGYHICPGDRLDS